MLVVQMASATVKRVVTMDLHCQQVSRTNWISKGRQILQKREENLMGGDMFLQRLKGGELKHQGYELIWDGRWVQKTLGDKSE